MEAFDTLRSGLTRDRSQCYEDLAPMFYGANRPGARVSQETLDQFWLWSIQAGLKNAYESEAAEGGWGLAGTAFGKEEFGALAAKAAAAEEKQK